MKEVLFKLWFAQLPIPSSTKIFVLESNISLEKFFNYNIQDYISLGINIVKANEIANLKDINKFVSDYEYLVKNEIKYILYNESEYPEELKTIFNPPIGLFIKGEIPNLNTSIAIVGARRASDYGKSAAYKLAYELAGCGITVISGMARGIDSASHRGSLDGNGITLAVMGSGFKNIYPKENSGLYSEIIKRGCVITEHFPDTPPFAYNFPLRNRIISGLSKFVLVVEAGEKSGSLITATLALEQGKDVFALPGNIFSYGSMGTNKLIQDGAKVITCVNDILEEFKIASAYKSFNNLGTRELEIVELLKPGGMRGQDIINNSKYNLSEVLGILSKLECKNIIRHMYGDFYILC